MPVEPTQYDMSTRRASSSRELKSDWETSRDPSITTEVGRAKALPRKVKARIANGMTRIKTCSIGKRRSW
jgi:hypothetical protein